MRLKSYYLIVVTIACCFLFLTNSCKVTTPEIEKAAKDIKKGAVSASENLKDAAENLSEGLAKLDPIALKTLIRENSDLRDQLNKLRIKIEGASEGKGTIALEGRRLLIEIVQYTGSFRIDGWLDTENNWFWSKRRFDDKNVKLRVDFDKVINEFYEDAVKKRIEIFDKMPILGFGSKAKKKKAKKKFARKFVKESFGGMRKEIAAQYSVVVNNAFSDFLTESAVIPSPDNRFIDLHDQLRTDGDHVLTLIITPVSADQNQRWSMRGRIVTVAKNGKKERIKEFDVDSSLYPNHALGKPLPDINAFLSVSTSN